MVGGSSAALLGLEFTPCSLVIENAAFDVLMATQEAKELPGQATSSTME